MNRSLLNKILGLFCNYRNERGYRSGEIDRLDVIIENTLRESRQYGLSDAEIMQRIKDACRGT